MPVVDADPFLSQLLTKYAEEVRSSKEGAKDTFRGVVERTIAELMPHGNARAVEIARRLGNEFHARLCVGLPRKA